MTRTLTVADRFTDTSLFTPYDDNAAYAKRNVSVDRGRLRLDVEPGVPNGRGAGGWLGPKAVTYGRWELGFQAFGGSGTGLAVILWPTSDVWSEGEVDAFEGDFGSTSNVDVNVHRQVKGHEAEVGYKVSAVASWDVHHLYGITWAPGLLSFDVDGIEVGRTTDPLLVPKTLHRLTLQSKPQPGSAAGYVLLDTYAYETV